MSYTWVACEMKTGRIIADLPDLVCSGVSVQLADYTSTTAVLPLSTAPQNWERVISYGGAWLVLVDPAARIAPWGGFVTRAPRTLDDSISLSLMTVEGYFDRRYVRDENYSQYGQNLIIKDLITKYVKSGSNGGIPLRINILDGSGTVRDRAYTDAADKTVFSVMQDLNGVIAGPEWSVSWEVADDWSTITPVLNVGSRLGSSVPDGLGPNATFELPGPVTDFQRDGDYGATAGANDVLAVSTAATEGNTTTRPQSRHVVISDPDRPTFEYRFTPSTSITDTATLNSHAVKKAASMFGGSNGISLVADLSAAPKLGVDWFLGDDIGYKVTSPAFPGGLEGVARVTGWEIDFPSDGPATITPTLLNPDQVDPQEDTGDTTE